MSANSLIIMIEFQCQIVARSHNTKTKTLASHNTLKINAHFTFLLTVNECTHKVLTDLYPVIYLCVSKTVIQIVIKIKIISKKDSDSLFFFEDCPSLCYYGIAEPDVSTELMVT